MIFITALICNQENQCIEGCPTYEYSGFCKVEPVDLVFGAGVVSIPLPYVNLIEGTRAAPKPSLSLPFFASRYANLQGAVIRRLCLRPSRLGIIYRPGIYANIVRLVRRNCPWFIEILILLIITLIY